MPLRGGRHCASRRGDEGRGGLTGPRVRIRSSDEGVGTEVTSTVPPVEQGWVAGLCPAAGGEDARFASVSRGLQGRSGHALNKGRVLGWFLSDTSHVSSPQH